MSPLVKQILAIAMQKAKDAEVIAAMELQFDPEKD